MKLQFLGHLMQTVDSLEKILILGKIEGKKRRRQQRMRCLDSTTDSMNKLQEIEDVREALHGIVHGFTKKDEDTT